MNEDFWVVQVEAVELVNTWLIAALCRYWKPEIICLNFETVENVFKHEAEYVTVFLNFAFMQN